MAENVPKTASNTKKNSSHFWLWKRWLFQTTHKKGTVALYKVLKRYWLDKSARIKKLAFFNRLSTFMVPGVLRSKIG